jgi:hypothetical protein
MAGMEAQASTVDPGKWLGMIQRWVPAEAREALVDFINSVMEAAAAGNPERVGWLDGLIVHLDADRRTGRDKFKWLTQYRDEFREKAWFWPNLRELRRCPDFDVVLRILRSSGCPLRAGQIRHKFPKSRAITLAATRQLLGKMIFLGLLARHGNGVYGLPNSAAKYETQLQKLFKLVYAAPGHERKQAEARVVLGWPKHVFDSAVHRLRDRKLLARKPGKGAQPGKGMLKISPERVDALKRGAPILDERGQIFFRDSAAAPPADNVTWGAFRRAQAPAVSPGAQRRAAARARAEATLQFYIEQIEAHPEGPHKTREEFEAEVYSKFGASRAMARDCRAEAIKGAENWNWAAPGRPPDAGRIKSGH